MLIQRCEVLVAVASTCLQGEGAHVVQRAHAKSARTQQHALLLRRSALQT